MDQNNQGRRPHYHRGRRGPDRRGQERRQHQAPSAVEGGGSREQPRDVADVEQIMREIRARISQRHGIDLSPQQIQELAARRLEAILDPRSVKPSLLEQMRRGTAVLPEEPAPAPAYTFDDSTLFETHRGLLRTIRKLLHPILKLFFNPTPIAQAFAAQARLNAEAAARSSERERRQAEWNALHYDILQRIVTENSRLSLELQAMALRVESLATKVDFNERRVRSVESAGTGSRQAPPPARIVADPPAVAATAAADAGGTAPASDASGEGNRRRRRRRRGRRAGGGFTDAAAGIENLPESDDTDAGETGDADETGDERSTAVEAGRSESAVAEQPIDAPISVEPAVASEPHPPFPPAPTPPPAVEAAPEVTEAATAALPERAIEQEPMSAPPDDPGSQSAPPDPGPQDR